MNLNRIIKDYPKLVERVEALERALQASKVDNLPIIGSKLPLETASERPHTGTLTLRRESSVGNTSERAVRTPKRPSGSY